MTKTKSILLVGVGGQGTILASKILSVGLLEAGYDVKMSEIHGMSQRGGSVSTQVRFGKEVFSPIIGLGKADVLISFESMEALRWLEYLKPDGKVIVNDYQLDPPSVRFGTMEYDQGITKTIEEVADANVLKASEIAIELGNIRVMNIVLLGSLVKTLDLTHIDWERVISENVKENFIEINKNAFRAGMDAIELTSI